MAKGLRRRSLFQLAGAAALLRRSLVAAPQVQPPTRPGQRPGVTDQFPANERHSTVAIAHGDDRRKNVYNALKAIDKDLREKMKTKRYVVIKPNFVNTQNQLAASNAGAMRGILDYLDRKSVV